MGQTVQRKLTTIFCADVQGYTKLMEDDEGGTLDTLMRYREAMGGLIARRGGRVVNTWGDALIAEFASPVEAVQAAVEAQGDLAQRNAGLLDSRRMLFRIGLNLGDVIVEGEDLYGEGVNIAARLQSLANPGGIMISGTVYDQVRKKFEVGFEFVGEQKVKNIEDPVPSYRVLQAGGSPGAAAAADYGRAASGGRAEDRDTMEAEGASPDVPRARPLLSRLPRSLHFPLAMIGLLFLINLFSGLGSIWFHWPSLPFILMMIWGMLRGSEPPRSKRSDRDPRSLRS